MVLFALVFSAFAGICMGLQSPTNTELSRHVGNLQATAVSFGGGMTVLLIAVLVLGDGNLQAVTQAQPWQLIGGMYGVCIVLVITYAVPVLGIALTVTFVMLGQMFMGMIIDGFGLFLVEQSEVSFLRIAGCLVVTAGIIIVCRGRLDGSNKVTFDRKAVLMSVLSLLAGAGGGIQAPTNASLATYVGNLEASFVSFTGGFVIIFTVLLISSKGRLKSFKSTGVKPWMCIGGLYGSMAVLAGVIATPVIGVALSMACTLLGQLFCGIIVDSTGILRSPKLKMNVYRYAGVAVILAGILLFSYGRYV